MTAKILRTLTPELMALTDADVATGLYGSASEVVRASLRLLAEQDPRQRQLAETAAESESESESTCDAR